MSSSLSLTAKESFANYLDYKDDISYDILQKGYDPKTTPKSHELAVIKELHVKNLINYDFYLKQRDIINLVHYDDNSIGCLDFFLYILFIALCISVIIFIWTYFPQVILFDILDKSTSMNCVSSSFFIEIVKLRSGPVNVSTKLDESEL